MSIAASFAFAFETRLGLIIEAKVHFFSFEQ